MRTMTRPVIAIGILGVTLLLGGCTPTVALQPAPDATNTACAQVVVGLPDTVAGLDQRKTDAQGTSAWGDPTAIRLWCGVSVPPPTAEFPCYSVEGVDWLLDDTEAPDYVFTTYGRDPAVELRVDSDLASGSDALKDLAFAVSVSPKERECVGAEDVFE
jgi:hypothetical protein